MSDFHCFNCKKPNVVVTKVGRRDECHHCGSDLHACKNCEFYDPKSYNECRENSAEVVREKDRANYCDFFNTRKGAGAVDDHKAKLKAAAEALFKKKD